MTKRMKLRTGALAVLGALAVAGCGGAAKHAAAGHGTQGGSGATGASASAASASAAAGASPAGSAPAGSAPAAKAARRGSAGHHGKGRSRAASAHSDPASGNAGVTNSAAEAPASPAAPAVADAPPVPPSFASQADSICRTYRHNVAGLPNATSLTEQEQVGTTLLREAHSALSRLSALSPPSGDAAAFTQYTHLTSVAVGDFVKAQVHSRSTKESVGVSAMQQNLKIYQAGGRAATAAGGLARRLGMHVCGSAGSDWL
jgi:hypothetical protein